jgi:2Fe-2S ferredoxin
MSSITVLFHVPGPGGRGETHEVTVPADGRSLMKAAVDAGVDGIAADCGGNLTCATCHVYVREPWLQRLPGPSADEDTMLDFTAEARQPNSRLSCQIRLVPSLDGLEVDVPARQY